MADCAECGAEVETPKRVSIGELIECPECEAMLEVLDVDPVVLELATEVEGDDEGSSDGSVVEDNEDWLQ
jgi:lysine biosynthesis protein LysW